MTDKDYAQNLEQHLLKRIEKITEVVMVKNSKLDNCFDFLIRLGLKANDIDSIYYGLDDVDSELLMTKLDPNKTPLQKITIGLTENDLQQEFNSVVYHDTSFSWIYPDQHGQDIEVEFINQDKQDEEED